MIKIIQLNNIWIKDKRIQKAREIIIPKINRSLAHSKVKFDSQDLEQQILFRLTTGASLEEAFEEQKSIVIERMQNAEIKPEKLFVFGFKRKNDWIMKWSRNKKKLYAVHKSGRKIEVIFKEIGNEFSSIIDDYHYIHCSRDKGMTFCFFLKGKKYPFAIEQVEPCSLSRNYKKAILMLLGINYHTTVELTRFYSVPNTPKNLVGILDKLVGRRLREKGYEWMMTAVMPTFAKTRATTIAGGIDTPIFAKELKLQFFQREDGKFQLCVNRNRPENVRIIENKWKLFPVIEMIKPLVKGLKPDIEKNKLYYICQ
ncbi:MAG: hypothetical protein ACTSR2_02840 [Candidatus Hodarchaeales archaeon]